jgi:hypothetical protein
MKKVSAPQKTNARSVASRIPVDSMIVANTVLNIPTTIHEVRIAHAFTLHLRLRPRAACVNDHDFPEQWQIFTSAESAGLMFLFASREQQDDADALVLNVDSIRRCEPSESGILAASAGDT